MSEDLATFGVVAIILLLGALILSVRRMTRLFPVWSRVLRRPAVAGAILVLLCAALAAGVARVGLVNSQPGDQHVEHHRENNRLILSEDENGCLDMRTLGRSNGVYLSVKPCKGIDKKDEPARKEEADR